MFAAIFAQRAQAPLHLVLTTLQHVEHTLDDQEDVGIRAAASALGAEVQRLRALGVDVHSHFSVGPSDERLMTIAGRVHADLVIVASDHPRLGLLPHHRDLAVPQPAIPVLAVRDSASLRAWLSGTRSLRVVLGADLSDSTKDAAHFIGKLCALGRCDVVAVHLYWPPAQFARLGLTGARSYLDPDPEVIATLQRDLRKHLAQECSPCGEGMRVRLEPHLGRLGDRIAQIANEERADLVIVGSHARSALERLRDGSVSRIVLDQARVSVACVPADGVVPEQQGVRDVMVATDFSAAGDAAVRLAYTVASRGATVHLVHVVSERPRDVSAPHDIMEPRAVTATIAAHEAARRKLAELVPTGVSATDKATRLHIVESNHVAEAICQAAERLDAGMIVVGSHGQGMLASVLLGSVAHAVIGKTRRPILLARAPHL